MRLIHVLIAFAALCGFCLGAARAQDPAAAREERIRRIRQLPPEDKQRLKEALDRYRALPKEQREALKGKARAIGPERLGELAGRDVGKLRQRHDVLRREMEELMKLLGGPERFAALTPQERAYIETEAMRGFQRHCRLRLLEPLGFAGDFDARPPKERRERMEKAIEAAMAKLLDEKTPEEQARYRQLSAPEQRRERAKLMAEWRLRETVPFARKFEGNRLFKFMEQGPEKRAEEVGRRVRWFQVVTLLRQDGVSPEAMRTLGQLRPDERAQVAFTWEQARDLSPGERRARVEAKIQELYGRGAVEEPRVRERPYMRLRELQREHRDRPPVAK